MWCRRCHGEGFTCFGYCAGCAPYTHWLKRCSDLEMDRLMRRFELVSRRSALCDWHA